MTDINTNEKLVEELAQAIASDDGNAAVVAATVIVGKVLDLFERHVLAMERQADAMTGIAEMLNASVHRADSGFFIKTS